MTRLYNMYERYYWGAAVRRMALQRKRFKMMLQKLAGVIILLMCMVMFLIGLKDSGNTDITAILLFLPMGISALCSKRKM